MQGTVTDTNGHYTLRGEWAMGDIVLFTFIGMKEVSVKYTGQIVQDAAMQQDATDVSEVVVVARRNINEIDIRAKSGVVQRVDMERLNDKPMIDMSLALQGAVPGLIVTNTGDLGSKPQIRLRGNSSFRAGDTANEPLYVMDGQIISSDAFLTLNPADIEEIKVLKDAVACALYGVKAANGVIEITSQRGNPDGVLKVNYDFSIGITLRGRRGVEMMQSDEKLELERLLQNPSTPGYRYSADYYRKYYPNDPSLTEMIAEGARVLDSLRGINTDWFRELIRPNIYQRHNLSIRGGNENTSYFISANYSQQGGRVPGNDVQRISTRMSLDQRLGRWGYLSLASDAGYSITNTRTAAPSRRRTSSISSTRTRPNQPAGLLLERILGVHLQRPAEPIPEQIHRQACRHKRIAQPPPGRRSRRRCRSGCGFHVGRRSHVAALDLD